VGVPITQEFEDTKTQSIVDMVVLEARFVPLPHKPIRSNAEIRDKNISGKEVTPYILTRLYEKTKGGSLTTSKVPFAHKQNLSEINSSQILSW
jgi:pseudouridine-5'-phosphate glycosidase